MTHRPETRRVVAVHATGSTGPGSLDLAMLEDVVDLVAEMQQVDGALVAASAGERAARDAAWPGMPVLVVDGVDVATGLDALVGVGADEGALVCADAPDLPALLLGKLFSALTSVDVAVCPAEGGGLVALASRVPVPGWLRALNLSLDAPDALAALRAAAPARGLLVGAGWHRVHSVADAMRLDRGLEGWEATRAWLAVE
jgi:glycosyltransferase A (GT-A) superfamily protein (DUF2064 family)